MARILIAEDEPHIIRVMTMWLARQGHTVIETRNGAEAVAALKAQAVDLVISDMNMPVLDGMGMIKVLREELGLDVPVLMLSSRCDQASLAEQVKAFRVTLYPKPFTPSRLVEEIDRLLAASVK